MLPSFWDNCSGVCNSESSRFNIRLVHKPSLLVVLCVLNATGQVCAFLRMLRYQVGSQTFTVGVVF